jgi:hypothetical protein
MNEKIKYHIDNNNNFKIILCKIIIFYILKHIRFKYSF